MVSGSAAQAYNPSSLSYSNTLISGVSNQGLGGWNQVGCLIYEVISSKNRPKLATNQGSSNVWEQQKLWDTYQTTWPTLVKIFYDTCGGWYCPPTVTLKGVPAGILPCEAFPCSLGSTASSPSAIQSAIQYFVKT